MSISSTLIQACLTNVQKEFRQLEHWLNSLHPVEPSVPSSQSNDRLESALRDISTSIAQLSKQYEVQQLALNHLVDRLDILEGARTIQIDDNDDPWLMDSDGTCLENTIIEPEESIYVIHKEEIDSHTPVMTKTPPASPTIAPESASEPTELVQEVAQNEVAQNEVVEPVSVVEPVKEVEPVSVVELVKEVEPVSVVEPVQEEEEVQEEVQEEEVQEEEEEVQEEEEEEEVQEEEEEEGVELEEITYKEKSYYKDGEGFIYGIDEEGQPTDQPIGIWKEKTQSVAFYRLK